MPSKGNRAASRQAKLRQKKRRGKGADQAFDVGPAESKRALAEAEGVGTPEKPSPAPSTLGPAPATPRPSRRARRAEAETAPRYGYLGGELKRIGVTTSIIVVLLVALSFVLGG